MEQSVTVTKTFVFVTYHEHANQRQPVPNRSFELALRDVLDKDADSVMFRHTERQRDLKWSFSTLDQAKRARKIIRTLAGRHGMTVTTRMQ